jgi:hypothetical protein
VADLRRRALLVVAALVAPLASFRARALPAAAPAAFGIREFLALSQRLTGKASLDERLAAIYLEALLAVPGNAEVLARLARRSRTRTPAELGLEATVVEWWYTGAYEVGGARRVATHDGALMWQALGRNPPGTCAGEFGAWARPPQRRA